MKQKPLLTLLLLSLLVVLPAYAAVGDGEVIMGSYPIVDEPELKVTIHALEPRPYETFRFQINAQLEISLDEGMEIDTICFDSDYNGLVLPGSMASYHYFYCYDGPCTSDYDFSSSVWLGEARVGESGDIVAYFTAGGFYFYEDDYHDVGGGVDMIGVYGTYQDWSFPKHDDHPGIYHKCYTRIMPQEGTIYGYTDISLEGWYSALIEGHVYERVIEDWDLIEGGDHSFNVAQLETKDEEFLRYAFSAQLPEPLGTLKTATTICFQANESNEVENAASGWGFQWLCALSGVGCQANTDYQAYFFTGSSQVLDGEVHWVPSQSIDNGSFATNGGPATEPYNVVTFGAEYGLPIQGGEQNFVCYMEIGGNFGSTFLLNSYRVDEWDSSSGNRQWKIAQKHVNLSHPSYIQNEG